MGAPQRCSAFPGRRETHYFDAVILIDSKIEIVFVAAWAINVRVGRLARERVSRNIR
jgi:hypothetical protein